MCLMILILVVRELRRADDSPMSIAPGCARRGRGQTQSVVERRAVRVLVGQRDGSDHQSRAVYGPKRSDDAVFLRPHPEEMWGKAPTSTPHHGALERDRGARPLRSGHPDTIMWATRCNPAATAACESH